MDITTALTPVGSGAPPSLPLSLRYIFISDYIMKLFAIICLATTISAEADPTYVGGLGYSGLGYAGLGYGVHHAAGYASVSPSASVNIAGLAPAAVPAVGGLYAGAGRYVANSAGTVHVAKREAEADADAYYAAGYGL